MDPDALSIDGARLHRRIDELARIGAIDGTEGCCRLALTDEDRDGRDLVLTWMRELGLDITIDRIGNVIATMPMSSAVPGAGDAHDLAPVLTGSHIDTVATGGRFDGNLGVLAGLEVIETVMAAGIELPRPLAVGWFTDEEGARFAPDMLGSLVYVGGMALEAALDVTDAAGVRLGDELERIGYAGAAPVPGPAPHAFVELHIEQGPVLEDRGIRLGAVESVQGISWTEYTVSGRSAHAGTTPMPLRRDPGVVASRVNVFARELTRRFGAGQVATCGLMTLRPNLVNVVPSSATFTVDLRNTDDSVLRRAESEVDQFVHEAAADEGCTVEQRSLARFEPVQFHPSVVGVVERIGGQLAGDVLRMPSGAGHDAQMFARVCPAGMIFTPSVNGISHNVTEYTEPDDIELGANTLLRVMLELAATEFGAEVDVASEELSA